MAGGLMTREAQGGLGIPGTTFALFHLKSEAAVIPLFKVEELIKLKISEPSGDRSAGASMISIRVIFMTLPSIPLISNGLDRS